jgi:hypothetical protein
MPRAAFDHLQLAYSRLRVAAGRGKGRGRMLPDYLLIGAAKSGTTSLQAWLADHPFVLPATMKEVHYFDYYYYYGEDWYRIHFPAAAARSAFEREHRRPFLTGEASPTYLSHQWAPERIRRALPGARLLVLLRNPVDRAYSQYQMSVREDLEDLPFEEALEREAERLAPELRRVRRDRHHRSLPLAKHSYLHRSHYDDQMERWLALFPRSQFHVARAEDLESSPQETLDGVHAFLELPPHRSAELPRLHTAPRYPPMAPETRARLVDYFRPRNERLSALLHLDLDWDR